MVFFVDEVFEQLDKGAWLCYYQLLISRSLGDAACGGALVSRHLSVRQRPGGGGPFIGEIV